jgi:ABC-2 type transport system ATP-binding protein
MTNIIETHQLKRSFGKNDAVAGIDLTVPEGSKFALLGPNGAGKTTTLKLLVNILFPTSGSAEIFGVCSRRLGPAEFQKIGYVSENQQLPEWMSLGAFLKYCKGLYPLWDDAWCATLLDTFGLPPERRLKEMSRGMKMKAALLSSLAYRPKVLILDEPFSGLDIASRAEFLEGIHIASAQSSLSVIVSSHDMEEVLQLADRIAYIDAGVLHLQDSTARLRQAFRRVEAVVEKVLPTGNLSQPPPLPPTRWMDFHQEQGRISFVDREFEGNRVDAELRGMGWRIVSREATEMSLMEIVVALSKPASRAALNSRSWNP